MSKLGIIYDNRLLDHKIKQATKECPERLRNLYVTLQTNSHNPDFDIYPLREIKTKEILAVHSKPFLDQIRNHCLNQNPFSYDKDTYLMEDSLYTARLAAGGCLQLADGIIAGEIDRGFAVVRPPGHHSTMGRAMGFCILNNVALTAQYLIDRYRLERILILDFDVHHGNGTQEVFYNSGQVLVISIHQRNLFPFSGLVEEFGTEAGLGYNINLPVYAQYGDTEYSHLFGRIAHNVIEQFLPQIILVSAGYDAHEEDNISDIRLTTNWFADITEILKYFAWEYSNNKLMYVLEGGYYIPSLEASVLSTMEALASSKIRKPAVPFSKRAADLIEKEIYPVLKSKWTI